MNLSNLFLATLPLIAIRPGPVGPINRLRFQVNSSVIGPYVRKQADTIDIEIYNPFHDEIPNLQFLIYVSCDRIQNHLTYFSEKFALKRHETKTIKAKLDNNFLYDTGLEFKCILRKDGLKDDPIMIQKIYPYKKETILINNLADKHYESQICSFELKKSRAIPSYDIFDFSSLNDVIIAPNYYFFPLDQIKFDALRYQNNESARYSLNFVDSNDMFKSLQINSNKEVNLPLKESLETQTFSFTFNQTLFVDPKTFEMSVTAKQGFVSTSNLYLPLNGYEKIKNYDFTIKMINFGVNKNDYLYRFKYERLANNIGECANSDFCVIGGRGDG